jgi:hypothetical protein
MKHGESQGASNRRTEDITHFFDFCCDFNHF